MSSKKVFIDGRAGTTGLRIAQRLSERCDIELVTLAEEERKDPVRRAWAMNQSDAVFLCLPDDAAREAVTLLHNPDTVLLDASTAHRTQTGWAYGFPELGPEYMDAVKTGKRVAVPGCHASGFVALVHPLVMSGLLSPDSLLSAFSLTGYSGGGKKMIAQYEDGGRDRALDAPRIYGVGQTHKHLPEMTKICGLHIPPLFSPIVADYYSGMLVTVPLHASQTAGGAETIRDVYRSLYTGPMVKYVDSFEENGFYSGNALSGRDVMEVTVAGNEDRITLMARFDNLGKGASGAAIECMNIAFGLSPETGLVL